MNPFYNENYSNEKIYKLYLHTNKANNKRYVGITKQEVEKRWGKNGHGYKANEEFWNDICEYGWNEGFTHEILFDNLTHNEVNLLEKIYIYLYNSNNQDFGYNQTKGGDSFNGRNGNEVYCVELDMYFDSVEEASKYIGRDSSSVGKVARDKGKTCKGYHFVYTDIDNFEEQVEELRYKDKIYCVELDKYFDRIIQASEELDCRSNYISQCLNGRKASVNGYHFIYSEEVTQEKINEVLSEEYNKRKSTAKQIYCVELDRYFDSITEAGKIIGCKENTIQSALSGRSKTAKDYHWVYTDIDNFEEQVELVMSKEYNKRKSTAKQIYCIELDMYFDSIAEASEELGLNKKSISNVLYGYNKSIKGYHFIFAKDIENNNDIA